MPRKRDHARRNSGKRREEIPKRKTHALLITKGGEQRNLATHRRKKPSREIAPPVFKRTLDQLFPASEGIGHSMSYPLGHFVSYPLPHLGKPTQTIV